MSSQPDLSTYFAAMEKLVEAQPEGVNAEIARGVYLMSPRPGVRHGTTQGRLFAILHGRLGRSGSGLPDWLFVVEPEVRSEAAFSRLIPDLAGWRKSTTGWPDIEENPISLAPEWVVEILSKHTENFDRGPKKTAYGLMGVAWLWLLDVHKKRLMTFHNVRGQMVEGSTLSVEDVIDLPPLRALQHR